MKKIFEKTRSLRDVKTHYCPGCGHGIIHRLICEAIDELGVAKKVIAVSPVGCAVIAYYYWDYDTCEAPHGRTPAVATGIKRVRPDRIVFSYQGDGDLAAIGTGEIIHTAARGENITVIFVNNTVYGMTSGQMAPTTLVGQKTATTPLGRDVKKDGYPLKISELIAGIQGVKYVERVSVSSPKDILHAKKAIKRAFKNQIDSVGFSMVEVLSMCPTYWGKSPVEAVKRIEQEMKKEYPLGVLKE